MRSPSCPMVMCSPSCQMVVEGSASGSKDVWTIFLPSSSCRMDKVSRQFVFLIDSTFTRNAWPTSHTTSFEIAALWAKCIFTSQFQNNRQSDVNWQMRSYPLYAQQVKTFPTITGVLEVSSAYEEGLDCSKTKSSEGNSAWQHDIFDDGWWCAWWFTFKLLLGATFTLWIQSFTNLLHDCKNANITRD